MFNIQITKYTARYFIKNKVKAWLRKNSPSVLFNLLFLGLSASFLQLTPKYPFPQIPALLIRQVSPIYILNLFVIEDLVNNIMSN